MFARRFLAAALVLLTSTASRAEERDYVVGPNARGNAIRTWADNSGWTVEVSARYDEALRSALPDFAVWAPRAYDEMTVLRDLEISPRVMPNVLLADVTGDGLADVVLDGHTARERILVCLVSSPRGPRAVVVDRTALTPDDTSASWEQGARKPGRQVEIADTPHIKRGFACLDWRGFGRHKMHYDLYRYDGSRFRISVKTPRQMLPPHP